MDQLFKIFSLMGFPSELTWLGVTSLPDYEMARRHCHAHGIDVDAFRRHRNRKHAGHGSRPATICGMSAPGLYLYLFFFVCLPFQSACLGALSLSLSVYLPTYLLIK